MRAHGRGGDCGVVMEQNRGNHCPDRYAALSGEGGLMGGIYGV